MLTGWRHKLSKLFIVPQRWILGVMCLFAVANAYTMRVCLNMAITQMVMTKAGGHEGDPDACPIDIVQTNATSNDTTSTIRVNVPRFEWDEATQGLLLSSFFYGYVITHVPGGMLAERFGGKWTLGIGLLVTTIGTLVTPFVVGWSGATGLFILRVIEGLGEGPTMPGMMTMLSKWTPPSDRGKMGSLVFGGAQIGNIAGSAISGLLLSNGNWPNVFYFFGGIGLLWFILWTLLCYSYPESHPYISDKEKLFLDKNIDHRESTKLPPTPWKALARSAPLWALIIAAVGHDWGYFTMVTDLPKYMTDVLKFNIKDTGFLASLPYMAMWISAFLFGFIGDLCTKRNWLTIANNRKLFTTIAATGPGICILFASYAGCSRNSAVIWFTVAMILMGAYYTGMKINPLDIAPNYSGSVTALVNGIAAISGIISPYLVGLLTPEQTKLQWRIAFWICLIILVGTNIVYIIWAKGDQQWWDDVTKHGYPTNWAHGPLPGHQDTAWQDKLPKSIETENGNVNKNSICKINQELS